MKYEILPDHRLKLICTPEESRIIKNDLTGTQIDKENGVLECLIANSELDWIDPADTGDLTSAPMLGILGEEIDNRERTPTRFGTIDSGDGMKNPIIARWAFMDYQVRSFLDDLAEKGECIWEGGYAEGFRPDKIDMLSQLNTKQ